MATLLLAFLTAQTFGPAKSVELLFVKVGPNARVLGRSAGQERAVVLIHGLALHPIAKEKIAMAELRSWQQQDSTLVKEISRHADVYALAYGQTAACERIAESPLMLDHLRGLKKAGYRDIVLVGHSAGGLIARHIVEDNSDLGVTKVIQVCCPNSGSNWAVLKAGRSVQAAFLASLTHAARLKLLEERKEKRIPSRVQFACVIGSLHLGGDGVVSCKSQWSEDLQIQGVPAIPLRTTHWDAVRSTRGAELLGRLVKESQKRWDERTVREVKKKLLGG
jgi:pimeloyl-ACP methyl ester carboxylesterase